MHVTKWIDPALTCCLRIILEPRDAFVAATAALDRTPSPAMSLLPISPVSSSSPLSFSSFYDQVREHGWSIVSTYDAPTLMRLAEQSVLLEEKVATGCLMIQAVTLLHYFRLARNKNPLEHTHEATQFRKAGSERESE